MRILVTPTSFNSKEAANAKAALESFADEVVYNSLSRPLTEDEVIEMTQGCDGFIAGVDFVTAKALEGMPPSMKVVSRYGTGVDRVDLNAAGKRGIAVTNTPGVNSEAVADLAIGMLISTARTIPALDSKLRSGNWTGAHGIEIFRKTIGLIGFGAIGKAVARRAKGFSMEVLAYDPYMDKAYAEANGVTACSFEEALEKSDFISLHLPYNESTRHTIDSNAIEKMKKGAILVNTARGGLIDEDAAYKALKEGKLAGLALDAFEVEPPGSSPLFELENVVVTPHIGAHTGEAVRNMAELSVKNLIDVLEGHTCPNIVNRDILKK